MLLFLINLETQQRSAVYPREREREGESVQWQKLVKSLCRALKINFTLRRYALMLQKNGT